MYPITLGVYLPANLASPPPETALEWFAAFQNNPITGLFFLGLADIVIMILWGPMSLAPYATLKQSDKTWSLIATPFVFAGMAVYLASNTAFSMLSLSQDYGAATTEAERSSLLAAGQAMLAVSRGTGSPHIRMPRVWLAGVIFSAAMLRSKALSKATAWVGIAGFALLMAGTPFGGHYTPAGTPPIVQSAIVAVRYVGGGLLSLAWYISEGLRLLKLHRS